MMLARTLIIVAFTLHTGGAMAADVIDRDATMKALIAASVSERLGTHADVVVDVLQSAGVVADPVEAEVVPGSRFGTAARFLVTLANGRRTAVVVRVQATAAHPVAARNLERDTPFADDDVNWIVGPLDGQLIAAVPAAADIVGARARRAIARGEVVTSSVLRSAEAVRAGDPITIVIRRGPIEVRGDGRAINGGALGDTIRVLRPGSRQPLQGRIVESAVVEILK